MNNILVVSNHHRKCCLFEDTIERLSSDIKHIWIQDTGREAWGAYSGPCSRYIRAGVLNYDQGMVAIKKEPLPMEVSHVLFIDNDCFIRDISVINSYVSDFDEGKFDFACHFVSSAMYNQKRRSVGTIDMIDDMTFQQTTTYPHIVSEPHFENTLMLFKRELWDSLTPQEVSHGRLLVKAMYDKQAKIGGHHAEYRLNYSHLGPGWFHVGNLMAYYYAIEAHNLSKFNPDSELDMSRLGFFFRHMDLYPSGWPSITVRLEGLSHLRQQALNAWDRLTLDTFLSER